MSNWISVNDRMPDKHGDYIVSDIESKEVRSSYYDLGNKRWENDAGLCIKEFDGMTPTHWQPLPEAPSKNKITSLNCKFCKDGVYEATEMRCNKCNTLEIF